MQTLSNLFEAELRKRLAARIEDLRDGLAAGGIVSFEDYKGQTGKLAGLREAIELCDEIATAMAQR